MIGVNISGAEYSWMPFAGAHDLDYLKSMGVGLVRTPDQLGKNAAHAQWSTESNLPRGP